MKSINEKTDIKKIIKDLGDADFSGSNQEQGKMVALMKGLAFSDDPAANKFMKAIDKATTDISKKFKEEKNKDESIEEKDKMAKDKVNEEEEVVVDPDQAAQAAFDADAIIIDVEQEIRLPDTDFILEPGDQIQVFPMEATASEEE